MLPYRKERIENAILFFSKEHYKKTKKYVSQTALYKYLAFFEFRCLKSYGSMPLELNYKAMKMGPVPIEVYNKRDEPSHFEKVVFEPIKIGKYDSILIKPRPNAKFEKDYFSENELSEMKNLIEIFAQSWVTSNIMSDASHQSIRAWKTTYEKTPNAFIDPKDEFDRDIFSISFDDLTAVEERYLLQRKTSKANV